MAERHFEFNWRGLTKSNAFFFIESLIFSGSKLILQLTDEQFQGEVRHVHLLFHDK